MYKTLEIGRPHPHKTAVKHDDIFLVLLEDIWYTVQEMQKYKVKNVYIRIEAGVILNSFWQHLGGFERPDFDQLVDFSQLKSTFVGTARWIDGVKRHTLLAPPGPNQIQKLHIIPKSGKRDWEI